MKTGKFLIASVLLLGTVGIVLGQGPLYDKVTVDLPYSVTIQNKTLPPGEYIIQQMPSAGNSHTVLIRSNGGTQFETSAMTIPALDNRTPNDTRVMLHRFGDDYYFDKIWVQGKNYDYEFPLPDAVRARERERAQSVSVAANYQATAAETQQAQTETQTQTQPEIAQNTPPPAAAAPAPVPAPAPEPQPAPASEAQPAPAPAPEPQAAPAPEAQPAHAPEAPVQMPRTDANWLAMVLGGGLLSAAGSLLRRSR